MSDRLVKLALALAATLLTLGSLEAGIRLWRPAASDFFDAGRRWALFVEWDPVGGYYRGVPNGQLTAAGVEYRFNSWGLRGPEPPATKPPGTLRIVTLGDSVTNGSGVAYADSFPALLGTDLGPRGIDVVPLSMGGWNTGEELNCLRRYIDVLRPDVAALLYVANDTEEVDPWEAAQRPPTTLADRLYRTLVVKSRLFEWAAWTYVTKIEPVDWKGLKEMVARRKQEKTLGPPFSPDHPWWLRSREHLAEMVALTRSRGATLVIYGWNLGSYPPGPVMMERLREFGDEFGVPVFDTAQLYTDEHPMNFFVLAYVDSHPNARAHRRLADYMERTLDDLGLLSRSPSASSPVNTGVPPARKPHSM